MVEGLLTQVEAMQRLMALEIDKIMYTGEFAEDVVSRIIDAMMAVAVEHTETIRRKNSKLWRNISPGCLDFYFYE